LRPSAIESDIEFVDLDLPVIGDFRAQVKEEAVIPRKMSISLL